MTSILIEYNNRFGRQRRIYVGEELFMFVYNYFKRDSILTLGPPENIADVIINNDPCLALDFITRFGCSYINPKDWSVIWWNHRLLMTSNWTFKILQ